MFKTIGIIVTVALALGVFKLCFFVAAPFVCGLVPVTQWKPLLDFAVYVAVAYFGGIAIPLFILVAGITISLKVL